MKNNNKLNYSFIAAFLLLIGHFSLLQGQDAFTLQIEQANIYALPPLHSYAHAQYDGKWLILGGQTSEDEDFTHANLELIVVDPEENKVWMMPSEELYLTIPSVEQLTSCYAQYYQEDGKFYLLGGYGYSTEVEGYITFPYMTVIDLKGAIESIIAHDFVKAGRYFHQIQDDYFGVMEGMLTKVKNDFYLVGGIEFYGFFDEENPHFDKIPKRDILKFQLNKNKEGILGVKHISSFDYSEDFDELMPTYVPQVFPNEKEGLTIFSNEALEGQDFASWLDYFDVGHAVSWQRTQKEYAPNDLVKKKIKPFANFGRDAKFLLNEQIPKYKNGVIKLNKLPTGKTQIGYIFGGASSVNPMIFQNGDILALATNQVFKVYLTKARRVKKVSEKVKGDPDID